MSVAPAPFLREPAAAVGGTESTAAGGGFESAAAAPATPAQKARATDLFLRGALTPEQLATATADAGGFEAVVGDPNFLPAVFLELPQVWWSPS